MGSLLSYSLHLKDFFTAPLRKAGVVGNASINKVTQAVQAATRAGGAMGNTISAANQRIIATTTKAATSIAALEIKLNTLKQTRNLSLNLSDITRANREIQRVEERMARLESVGRRKSGGSGMGASMGLLGGLAMGAGVAGVMGGVRDVAKYQGIDNAINFTSGSAQEGSKSLSFLDRTTEKMGLEALSAKEGFSTLSGSMMGTQLQGEATRRIFQQVATAATVLNMTGEESKRVYLALGQMMSKGTVASEELKGQVGEPLKGAFKIAADAMGVTQAQLGKMMEKGELVSSVFLPKFGAQLEKVFGGGLAKASQSLTANLNRFDSEWLRTKTVLVEEALPAVMVVMRGVRRLMEGVRTATAFVREHSTAFKVLGGVVLTVGAAILAYNAYIKIAALRTAAWAAATALYETVAIAAAGATGGWSTAMAILNAVMTLNPIGLIVAGVAALVAGVVYAWNTFEGFRGFLYGFAFGAMELFKGLGNIISGAFTINPLQIAQGVNQLMNIKKKYREAYGDGVDAFRGTTSSSSIFDFFGVQPGTTPTQPAGDNTQIGLSGGKGSKSSATGGGGITHITINVQQLGQTTIHTSTAREGIEDMKTGVRQALLSVLNDANAMTTAS